MARSLARCTQKDLSREEAQEIVVHGIAIGMKLAEASAAGPLHKPGIASLRHTWSTVNTDREAHVVT
jgi:hypothetical protein